MQLQVHSILSPQVTHDEKTPCEEQQVKEQVWNKKDMHYMQGGKMFSFLMPTLTEFIDF